MNQALPSIAPPVVDFLGEHDQLLASLPLQRLALAGKLFDLLGSLKPTLSGPTVGDSKSLIRLPPPRPIDMRSGIRKLVRTSQISTVAEASLGNPLTSTPTSDVVPPTSTTAQSVKPLRNAAPRIEFVGPEANVATGYCRV